MEDFKKIVESVNQKNFLFRLTILTGSVFMVALIYNVFLLPQSIIFGGVSSLAIVTKTVFGWNPAAFVLILNIILIIISYFCLGKETTMKTIVGSLLYPLFIQLTIPLANLLIPYLDFENFLIALLLYALLYGTFSGLIYKTGFTTGGSDVLMQLASKYGKMTMGKGNLLTSLILVMIGGLVYGLNKIIYAVFFIYLSTTIIDKIIIGISDSKTFFIFTDYPEKIEKFIINELKTGVTIVNVEGGFSKEKGKMIMTVVPTLDYYMFKEAVVAIDPDAFFVINDCYEVMGGVKRKKIPFN